MDADRRYPVGAEPTSGGTHVRVWAPRRQRVVVCHGEELGAASPLAAEPGGYFSALVAGLRPGHRYAFHLDDDDKLYPDPASRFQPEGPHGPSEVVDSTAFPWSDREWAGPAPTGQVIYELHVGTFTAEGTYAAAAGKLPALRELGATLVELMPVADFPGRFGWGYDGVDLWAPTRLYGRPDDLRRFVDAAHRQHLGVILDVVYNHLGAEGNYLPAFAAEYLSERYQTEWGPALNFDGPGSEAVREFVIENAAYWIDEFHLDGLRLDATQQIFDASDEHVLAALARRARAAAGRRAVWLVAENEPQDAKLVRPPDQGGYGLDALWNDDFHHTARVALTGRREAYYTDYCGGPQELLSAVRWGFLFQGQRYAWQNKRRGTPTLDLDAARFLLYLENHDQVANSASGARLATLAAPGELRAMTALLLLAPGTPMLFQGQELGTARPFLYFGDHEPALAAKVAEGRRAFLAQFPSLASPEMQRRIPDPGAAETFAACKLDWSERERHAGTWRLHRDLLALRRDDAAFRQQRAERVHGAVLGPRALALRYFCPGDDRLLLVNLGSELRLDPAPEPLLAPEAACRWRLSWSSEAPEYGGLGVAPVETDEEGWRLPGRTAVVLAGEEVRP